MNSKETLILAAIATAMVLSGCSHESWVKTEETTRVSGFFNTVLLPVNIVAHIGKSVTEPGKVLSSDSLKDGGFIFSKQITENVTKDDGEFSRSFTTIKIRFKRGDYGDIASQTNGNENIKTGRYKVGERYIIVKGTEDVYKVRYEDEVE